MLMPIFAVYDRVVLAYMPPFVVRTAGEAKRQLVDTVRDPNHIFARHPGDYHLVNLGMFDDSTGLIQPTDPPVTVMTADQAVATLQGEV